MKRFLPYVGDRRAREAWDEVFSRDVLGSVLIGGASGKFIENLVTLTVFLTVGPRAGPYWEILARLCAWTVGIFVGIYVFTYWHRIQKAAAEAAENATGD
jgi:hypothetical protein